MRRFRMKETEEEEIMSIEDKKEFINDDHEDKEEDGPSEAQAVQENLSNDAQRMREKREAEKAKKSDEITRAKLAYDKKNADKAIAAQALADARFKSAQKMKDKCAVDKAKADAKLIRGKPSQKCSNTDEVVTSMELSLSSTSYFSLSEFSTNLPSRASNNSLNCYENLGVIPNEIETESAVSSKGNSSFVRKRYRPKDDPPPSPLPPPSRSDFQLSAAPRQISSRGAPIWGLAGHYRWRLVLQ